MAIDVRRVELSEEERQYFGLTQDFINGLDSSDKKEKIRAILGLDGLEDTTAIKFLRDVDTGGDKEIELQKEKAIENLQRIPKREYLNFSSIDKKLAESGGRLRIKLSYEVEFEPKSPEIPSPASNEKEIIEKLLKEEEFFFSNQVRLQSEHPDCFVAIKDGKIVAQHKDREVIGRRVYEDYGCEPVLIRHVESGRQTVYLSSPEINRRG